MGLALSPVIKWSNAIHVMENTWLVACSTEETLFPRMSMLLLPQSRPNAPSNLWIGAQLVSRLVSTTNHLLLFLAETWQRSNVPFACYLTPLPSPRLGPAWTTSLT